MNARSNETRGVAMGREAEKLDLTEMTLSSKHPQHSSSGFGLAVRELGAEVNSGKNVRAQTST